MMKREKNYGAEEKKINKMADNLNRTDVGQHVGSITGADIGRQSQC